MTIISFFYLSSFRFPLSSLLFNIAFPLHFDEECKPLCSRFGVGYSLLSTY